MTIKNVQLLLRFGVPFFIMALLTTGFYAIGNIGNQTTKKTSPSIKQAIKPIISSTDKDTIPLKDVFNVVEEMPRFPGCEEIDGTKEEKKKCAEKKMLEFVYRNIKMPQAAREASISGTVVIRFVIDEEGYIIRPEILREIGGGCGEEALRVIKKMNRLPERWTSGKKNGKAVKVHYNFPLKFRSCG